MTRKRLLLIAVLPLAFAVTLGVLAMLSPNPGVTKAKFDRIEKGMTLAEVEAIFGGPGEVTRDDKALIAEVEREFGREGKALQVPVAPQGEGTGDDAKDPRFTQAHAGRQSGGESRQPWADQPALCLRYPRQGTEAVGHRAE